MKQKNLTHWLKVAVIGIALGIGLQFVRAWTEPTTAPPGGNVGAPINTSTVDQKKGNTESGTISAKDFCLNSDTANKCLSKVSWGTPTTTTTTTTTTPVSCPCGTCGDTYSEHKLCIVADGGWTITSVYICTQSGWSCTSGCSC